MTSEEPAYRIWVDWANSRASVHPVDGYEVVCFFTLERYQENLRILTQSGFQFE